MKAVEQMADGAGDCLGCSLVCPWVTGWCRRYSEELRDTQGDTEVLQMWFKKVVDEDNGMDDEGGRRDEGLGENPLKGQAEA